VRHALRIGLCLTLQVACAADDRVETTSERDNSALAQAQHSAATAAVFGEGVEPNRALAHVSDTPITVGDVALYLQLFPAMTTEDALEDLVDIRVAARHQSSPEEAAEHDARVRARALAWMEQNVWSRREELLDPARVEELLTDLGHTTFISNPELRTVTHILFSATPEEQTPERAAGAEALGQRIREELSELERPVFGFDLYRARVQSIPNDDPLLHGMPIGGDVNLTFPAEHSGPRTWQGIDAAVPRFAEAAFAAEVGEIVGPVVSDYGWHMLVVEEIILAETLSDEERLRRAQGRALREAASREIEDRVEVMLGKSAVELYQDNIQALAFSAEQRLRLEAEAQTGRFR